MGEVCLKTSTEVRPVTLSKSSVDCQVFIFKIYNAVSSTTAAFKTLKNKPRWIDYCILCFKLVLWPLRDSSSAETIVLFWAKVDVMEQLSPLSEFTSFWRRENAQSGVLYRTRTVFRILLDYKLSIHFVLHK